MRPVENKHEYDNKGFQAETQVSECKHENEYQKNNVDKKQNIFPNSKFNAIAPESDIRGQPHDLKTENCDELNDVCTIAENEDATSKDSTEDNESTNDGRETWDNPLEFLMSCISMSVGLGNVWRFPGVAARNGGGAFLIPYLLVLLFIGRPLYYLEMCLGQFSRFGQVKVWNMAPLFKGVGYGSITAVVCVCSYYVPIMAVTTYYLIVSFSAELPWTVCHEEIYGNETCQSSAVQGQLAQLYYDLVVFPQLDDIDNGLGKIHWKLALCLVASWILIFLALIKGVKSSGKVAYFTAIFPYIVLLILLIRGLTLPGAWVGIRYFIMPQWSALTKPTVWYAAVEQCFFSLATGFGPIIMFSSYNPFRQNIYKDVLIISFMDTFTSLLAGCTVFSVMGYLVEAYGLSFDEITGGPGLAFILYPQAIAEFGWVPQLFAVLFFLMLFTLGMGSATSLAGGIITIICDQFPAWKRWQVTSVVCICGCVIGLLYVTEGGLFMLDLVDHYGAGFIVYVMAILECVGVAYIYGLSNFCNDIEFMLGRTVGVYWRVCWGLVIPVGLLANLVYYLSSELEFKSGGIPYPKIATICGWLLTSFAGSLIPFWGIHAVATRKSKSLKGKLRESVQPTHRWGPQQPSLRREWLQFRTDAENSYKEMSPSKRLFKTIFG